MFVCLPEFAFRLCVIMHLVGLSVGFVVVSWWLWLSGYDGCLRYGLRLLLFGCVDYWFGAFVCCLVWIWLRYFVWCRFAC